MSTSAGNVGSLFFPMSAKLGLRVEATVSPLVERKLVLAGTLVESFPQAEKHLSQLVGLDISAARIRRATRRVGCERLKLRQQLQEYFDSLMLPRQQFGVPDGVKAPDIAAIMLDGGRLQILDRQQPKETSQRKGEHWRESRVGLLMNMTGKSYDHDPCPDLPDFLAGGADLEKKLGEISKLIKQTEEPTSANEKRPKNEHTVTKPRRSRDAILPRDFVRPLPGPEIVNRDCIASRDAWEQFGRLMAAEAWIRGFAGSSRKVCVTDGSDAIRRVIEKHFAHYTAILDLMHALGYAMNAARAVGGSLSEIRKRYRDWAEKIWQGRVANVITEMDQHQRTLGQPPHGASAEDPREALRKSRVYYRNQQFRMNYPEYRKLGYPLTSSLMESAVKQVNRRVKGSEKFWSELGGAELLALRADAISDGDQLTRLLSELAQPNDGFRQYNHAA